MRREVSLYSTWYNEERPHQRLHGLTPAEVYDGTSMQAAQLEPRPKWPLASDEDSMRVRRVQLVVKFVEGRRHLPIVELRRVA